MPKYEVSVEFTKVVEVNDTIEATDLYDAVDGVICWHEKNFPGYKVTHWTVDEFSE